MKKLLAPQDDALKLAQERAALPVSQGGLGLPANNTAEQRAKAMGFDRDTYHGSFKDIKKLDPRVGSTEAHAGKGVYSTDSPEDASRNYASIYGADPQARIERGFDAANKSMRKTHSRMRDEVLSPLQQEIILRNTIDADNLGVVYPLKVRSDKSIHLDKPEADELMVGPFQRYDEAADSWEDTVHTPKFNEALEEFRIIGGDANPIYELVQDYNTPLPASELFRVIKETGDSSGLYDGYSGDIVSGGVAAGDFMKHFGVDEIRHTPQFMNSELNIGGEHTISLDPDNVRSRFAAFDPFRKSAAIAASMGVAAPDLLAKEKEKKKSDGGKIVGGLGKIAKKLLEEPRIQTIEAPSIIIPSKLSNVKEMARKREGEYGARRVERASDEIPNLEKMYQEDALRRAFIGGDNARALMTMNPADFENYAAPLKPSKHKPAYASLEDRIKSGELYKDDLPTDEYVNYLRSISGGFDAIPFLEINKGEQGLPLTPFISGHEGRHRNRALASAGESTNLIQLLPRAELREPFPRRSQEEYIEALKKELAMTNNMVLPEKFDMPSLEELKQTAPEIYEWAKKNVKNNSVFDKKIQRSEIELPDIYAEGGAAFKTLQFKDAQHFDGGGIAFPEMTPMTEGSRREPLLTEKDWENIKRNAPEVYEWAKQNVKDEASQLKSARGVKDFALRTGAQYLGGIPDLVNLGLMGVDALADTNLSSEKPWFGSEQYIDAMRKVGMVGENEFPIAETVAGVLMPAGLIKKGIKKISGTKPAKQEPKKRQGGLSAMAR